MSKLSLYANTIRYLKPVQIYGRLWSRFYKPRLSEGGVPTLRSPVGRLQVNAFQRPSMLSENEFVFLNQPGRIDEPADWNSPDRDKLWLYNAHYFDDLNAADAADRAAWHAQLVDRWIADNPPGAGNGWEPYPISLRAVNWIKWMLTAEAAVNAAHTASLCHQIRYLRPRLETYLLGNHLLANAKALVFAGLFFAGREAEEWLQTGLKLVDRELEEQVLSDGGHFELSPMYHAIMTQDLLDLIAVAETFDHEAVRGRLEGWKQRATYMLDWLRLMTHPDGEVSLFNDGSFGITANHAQLQAFARSLGLPGADQKIPLGSHHLQASGYLRLEQADASCVIDVAEVGPDYLPAHAHADTLSFELSCFGERLLVNSGTSCYGGSAERLRQRGTAAHNTVLVDRFDSSEVWGGFRVARRARPVGLKVEDDANGSCKIRCGHTGYRRLAGRNTHWREWAFAPGGLSVVDSVDGEFGSAVARFHFAPEWKLELHEARLSAGHIDGHVVDVVVRNGQPALETTTYHPEFGVSINTQCLSVTLEGGRSDVLFSW